MKTLPSLKTVVLLVLSSISAWSANDKKKPAEPAAPPATILLMNLADPRDFWSYEAWKDQVVRVKSGLFVTEKATGKGGMGFKETLPNLTGSRFIEVGVALGLRNEAPEFTLILRDADGTEARFTYKVTQLVPDQPVWLREPVERANIAQPGTTPGLDLANLVHWDLTGDWVTEKPFQILFIAARGRR